MYLIGPLDLSAVGMRTVMVFADVSELICCSNVV